MVFIRSYAVATYIVGRGFSPVEIDHSGPTPTFMFPDAAKPVYHEYLNARKRLDTFVEEAVAAADRRLMREGFTTALGRPIDRPATEGSAS